MFLAFSTPVVSSASGNVLDDSRQADGRSRGRGGTMDRFERRRMDGTEFHDVSLAGAVFDNVNLSNARFTNVNLSGVSIENANIKGLRIFGYDVAAWIKEQLDRDCGEHH
jgi:uncharacterized protein YjbI with pentapeptide repeats